MESVNTTVVALAVRWCLDHYVPLLYADEHPWTLLSYERLLTQGEQEFQRVTDALGVALDPAIQQALKSRNVTDDDVEREVEGQLTKWKRQLTSSQVDTILHIVRSFGLDFYDEQPEPNYERLMQYQRPEATEPA